MTKLGHRRIAVLVFAILLGGCSFLAPQKEESRFFVLTPARSTAATPVVGAPRDLSIGLGPVTFPDYLKRPEVVTRLSQNQVELSEVNRWAEPLDSNFQQVLGQDLSQQLQTQRLVMFPWYTNRKIDYQVEVQVDRFDNDSTGQSDLDARWMIKDGKSGEELFATATNLSTTISSNDDAAGSVALSHNINQLSRQIADRIASLNRERAAK